MFRGRKLQAAAIGIGLTIVAIMPATWARGQSVTDTTITDLDEPGVTFVTQPGNVVQPPQPALQPPPRRQVTPRRRTVTRRPQFRLASVPNMFGDIFPGTGRLLAIDAGIPFAGGEASFPLAGGARRNKIAENNKALPMDRVYFMYNRYQDALLADTTVSGGPIREFAVEKFTVGVERTFFDGLCSIDVRMPFTTDFGFFSPAFDVQGGNVGNLAVAIKRSFYQTDNTSVVAGLGLDLPTGSDVRGRVDLITNTAYTVHNEAVLIQPFVGVLSASDDGYFFHGFLQLDVPTNGNGIDYQNAGSSGTIGPYNDQTLLEVDLAAGTWLHQDPRSRVSGLAALAELHYTTALQDSDVVSANVDPGGTDTILSFGGATNRFNILNLAFGLDAEVGLTNFRVGAVFPLLGGSNRMFDSEIQAQINRRY